MWLNIKKHINDNVYFNNFSLSPIQFVPNDNILIFRRIINLPLNTAVSIFIKKESYESIISIGYVSHIQENIIQVKILFPHNDMKTLLSESDILKQVIIRPASNVNNILDKLSGGITK